MPIQCICSPDMSPALLLSWCPPTVIIILASSSDKVSLLAYVISTIFPVQSFSATNSFSKTIKDEPVSMVTGRVWFSTVAIASFCLSPSFGSGVVCTLSFLLRLGLVQAFALSPTS